MQIYVSICGAYKQKSCAAVVQRAVCRTRRECGENAGRLTARDAGYGQDRILEISSERSFSRLAMVSGRRWGERGGYQTLGLIFTEIYIGSVYELPAQPPISPATHGPAPLSAARLGPRRPQLHTRDICFINDYIRKRQALGQSG
jgi:hypothetical protein